MADKKDSALSTVTPVLTDKIRGLDDPTGTPASVTFLLSAVKDLLKTSYDALYLAIVAPSTPGNVLTSNGSAWTSAAPVVTPSKIVQVVNYATGAVATGTTPIPYDDTIPQNTEGDQYMTLAITPTSATNKLFIEAFAVFTTSGASNSIIALFQDSTTNALASSIIVTQGGYTLNHSVAYEMVAGTTSPTTFKIRIGTTSGTTLTLNGAGGARLMGGILSSYIRITEIKV